MNVHGWKSWLRRRTGRPLVAAFAACWLGLAIQPCSAMGDMEHRDSPPCDHCPDQAPSACELGSALECDLADACGLAKPDPDLPVAGAIHLRAESLLAWLPGPERLPSMATGPPAWPSPPNFQQRYCRFLK